MGFFKTNRFFEKQKETFYDKTLRIIVDTETGVNYLMSDGGITPLLGPDGKPIVDREFSKS